MKNVFIVFLFFLLTITSYATIDAKVYYEKSEKGYKILAENNEFCPVSFKINFKTSNLKLKEANNSIYVIPARTKNFEVTILDIVSANKPYSIGFSSIMNYGDATLKLLTSNYIYDLPFKKGSEFLISQGYNGSFSHTNENSLDFNMPEETEIYSAREGVVVFVEQSNSKNCQSKDCSKFNNYIVVFHSDGTFAAYVHIMKNGAVVKAGDKITRSQLIGYSGNVGWSNGPHLHLVIYKQDFDRQITLKTKFFIEDGKKSEYLLEKKSYLKNY